MIGNNQVRFGGGSAEKARTCGTSLAAYPTFGCLPPGSLVKTATGMRPIDEVERGDLVYAGDGALHPVLLTRTGRLLRGTDQAHLRTVQSPATPHP